MAARKNSSATKSAERETVITHIINAPRALVFKAWTDPKQMAQWWGPKGFTNPVCEMDVRPGGAHRIVMRGPDGTDYPIKGIYREIVKPERIIFVNSFSDEKGGLTRHPMSPSWPLEMLSTITFAEHAGKTTVTVRWAPLNPTEEERKTFEGGFDSMRNGWSGTMDQLAAYLTKD